MPLPEPIVPLTVASTVIRMLHAGYRVGDIAIEIGAELPAQVDGFLLVETFARELQARGGIPTAMRAMDEALASRGLQVDARAVPMVDLDAERGPFPGGWLDRLSRGYGLDTRALAATCGVPLLTPTYGYVSAPEPAPTSWARLLEDDAL